MSKKGLLLNKVVSYINGTLKTCTQNNFLKNMSHRESDKIEYVRVFTWNLIMKMV